MRSIARFLQLALQPGGWVITVATTLGLTASTVAGLVLGSPATAVAAFAGFVAALCFVAGVRLQHRLEMRPTLALALEPDHTYAPGFHANVNYGGPARFCSVWATADRYAERCYGRIVACERREGGNFVPLAGFIGAVEVAWPKEPMQTEIDIEPDVPERLVVCIGLEDSNRVYLGTETGSVGTAINLQPGEYRFKVRLGFRSWTVPDRSIDEWFRIKHCGTWDQVEVVEDGSP